MRLSNWAARAFKKTVTNVFYSRGVSTRRRRSRRPAQQISLESLEPRQMLSINTVTTNADFGAGSLRQAIIDANATSANDEIVFAASLFTNGANTITLGSAALPTIAATSSAGSLAITGPGASSLTIDANGGNFSIFNIALGGDLSISGVKVSGANASSVQGGAFNNQGTLTVSSSTLSGNIANIGGGFYNSGIATVTNSTISGNSANAGGGAGNIGALTISNSTFSGNSASNIGGALFNGLTGNLIVNNSTLSGNSANGFGGGGIYNLRTATVTNSTISGNSSNGFLGGGGIYNYGVGSKAILNIANTIIANSTSGGDYVGGGTIGTNLNNLVEDGSIIDSSSTPTGSGNISGDPFLRPLQNNGGSTETMALGDGSPAIAAGDATISNAAPINGLDQRGFARTTSDIGAYSYNFASANDAVVSLDNSNQVVLTLSSSGTLLSDVHTSFNSVNNTLTITAATLGTLLTAPPAGIAGISIINGSTDSITLDLNTLVNFAGLVIVGNSGTDSITIGSGGVDLSAITTGATNQSFTANILGTSNSTSDLVLTNAIKTKGTAATYLSAGTINGSGLITTPSITMAASTGIGSTTALNLAAVSIAADSTEGKIDLNNTLSSAVIVTSLTSAGKTDPSGSLITFNQSGGGTATFNNVSTSGSTAGAGWGVITLTNAGGGITISGTGVSNAGTTSSISLTTTGSGTIAVNAAVDAGLNDGDVYLTSAGSITGSGLITGSTGSLVAQTGLAANASVSQGFSAISSAAGDISVANVWGISVPNAITATGNVSLTSGQDIVLSNPITTNSGTVTLTATGAAGGGEIHGGSLITANTVDLNATNGIGSTTALNLASQAIAADSSNGKIIINNTSPLAVTVSSLTTKETTNEYDPSPPSYPQVTLIKFNQTGGGDVNLTNVSTIGTTYPAAGEIELSNDGNLTVGAGGVVSDGASNIYIQTTSLGNIILNGNVDASRGDGAISLKSAGSISGTGALVSGSSGRLDDLTAGTGIDVKTQGLDFSAANISTTTGNMLIENTTSINLPAIAAPANLSIKAGGTISQNGAITVVGTASFHAANGAIDLINVGNDFTGAVSLANTGANNVAIVDVDDITIDVTSLGTGTFEVTGSSIKLNNNVATTNKSQTFTGDVVVNANSGGLALVLSAGSGAISITGDIDSATGQNYSLALTSTGDVIIGGNAGGTQALGTLLITGNDISLGNIGGANVGTTQNVFVQASDLNSDTASIALTGTAYNTTGQQFYNSSANAGSFDGTRPITLTGGSSGSTVNLITAGVYSNNAAEFTGSLDLNGRNLSINTTNNNVTTGGDITFNQTVNGAGALALNAGSTGNIIATGDIGATTTLTCVSITNAASGSFAGSIHASTIAINDTTNAGLVNFQGNLVVNTGMTIAANGAYNVQMIGNSNAIAGVTTFGNSGSITFGDAGNDTFNFTGGIIATTPSAIFLAGSVTAAGTGVITLGDSDTTVTVLGSTLVGGTSTGNITLGNATLSSGTGLRVGTGIANAINLVAVTGTAGGTAESLTFNTTGAITVAGAIGTDIGTVIITNSGGTTFQSTVDAATTTITNTTGTVAFQGNLKIGTTLVTTAQAYNVSITGTSNNIAGATSFLNTGTMALGDAPGDSTTFAGGLVITASSAIAIQGTVAATNSTMTLGDANTAITNSGTFSNPAILNAGTGIINLSGNVTGNGSNNPLKVITSGVGFTTVSGVNTAELQFTSGVVTLANPSDQTGGYRVSGGTLQGGSMAKVGYIFAQTGTSVLAPGINSPEMMHTNFLLLSSGNTVQIDLQGTTAGTGYDQMVVCKSGSVDLASATLSLTSTITPASGTVFTIIDNQDNSLPIIGTFSGLAEGAVITLNGSTYQISYVGGTGNDVTLQVITLPSRPTSVVATSGNTSLGVTWVAPASDGDSNIIEYIVKYSSNNGAAGSWTRYKPSSPITATSCTVTGLTNGTAYVIKVIARNALGISLPSANSAPATPAVTVPDSPTSVVATSGNASLGVTWVAPASNGGSAITEYIVKYSSSGGVAGSWTRFFPSPRLPITALACTVTGLTNGTSYVIKVIAKNAVGISLPSANSAPATPASVPDSPTSVVATSGNAGLAVTWTAPANTGGSAITEYLVKYSSNNGVAGSWTRYKPSSPITATACTVTGLTNGTAYVIKVIARNAIGISLPSANSAPVTPALLAMSMVTVGNVGNAADATSYGDVSYAYQIGAYDVTGSQYTAFLNAVGSTDTYALYNASMGTDPNVAQISRSGTSGSYTYAVLSSTGSRPISYVSWFDSARFSNWMSNGQPSGAQTVTTTEDGAYNVNGATSGNAVAANTTNPNTGSAPTYRIPLENEWYKAAYYSPNYGGTSIGGYYVYATQSDSAPGTTIGSTANQANYKNAIGTATDVGAFSGSGSFYGTFDQSGNVFQWNDLDGAAGSSRGLRGGGWHLDSYFVSSSDRNYFDPSFELDNVGFRLASPV